MRRRRAVAMGVTVVVMAVAVMAKVVMSKVVTSKVLGMGMGMSHAEMLYYNIT